MEYHVEDHGDGTYTVTTYEGGGDGTIFIAASAAIMLILSIIGMGIMVFNVSIMFIIPAILAILLFAVPIILSLGKGEELGVAIALVAKHAHLGFVLLVLSWWVMYKIGGIEPPIMIAILVGTMYAMYYFPVMLIVNGMRFEQKTGVPFAIVTGVLSLVGYLVIYGIVEQVNEEFVTYIPIAFSTMMTLVGSLFLYIQRFILYRENGEAKRGAIPLLLYLFLVAGVGIYLFMF